MLKRRSDVTLGPPLQGIDDLLISPVLIDGKPTGLTVHGIDLGPVFATRHGTLLFVEYGDDWEQSLTITLADAKMRVLDSATLGASGSTGHLRDVNDIGPNQIGFRFFGDRRWLLTLHAKPRLVVPVAAIGIGIQRPFQWRRWFKVGPA